MNFIPSLCVKIFAWKIFADKLIFPSERRASQCVFSGMSVGCLRSLCTLMLNTNKVWVQIGKTLADPRLCPGLWNMKRNSPTNSQIPDAVKHLVCGVSTLQSNTQLSIFHHVATTFSSHSSAILMEPDKLNRCREMTRLITPLEKTRSLHW